MRLDRLLLHAGNDFLRANRADTAADSRHPQFELISLINVRSGHLLALPTMFIDYPIPPDVCVTDPGILRFFPTFVKDLPAGQSTSAAHRFYMALRLDFIAMLVGALDRDYYWT